METAFRGQQAELEATSNELERIRNRATELERALAAATARNEWYIRTQNLAMDFEWATLDRRDGKPPTAVYRARATARAAEASALIPPRAE